MKTVFKSVMMTLRVVRVVCSPVIWLAILGSAPRPIVRTIARECVKIHAYIPVRRCVLMSAMENVIHSATCWCGVRKTPNCITTKPEDTYSNKCIDNPTNKACAN